MKLTASPTSPGQGASPPPHPAVAPASALSPVHEMSSAPSQQGLSTRITSNYSQPTSRNEDPSQSSTHRPSLLANAWPTRYTQGPDTSQTAIAQAGQTRRRVSPTYNAYPESTIPADTVPVPSMSGPPRRTDEPRNQNNRHSPVGGWEQVTPRFFDPAHIPRGYRRKNENGSCPTSLLDDGQENRGLRTGLNGSHDIDLSRTQNSLSNGHGNLSNGIDPSPRQGSLSNGYGNLRNGVDPSPRQDSFSMVNRNPSNDMDPSRWQDSFPTGAYRSHSHAPSQDSSLPLTTGANGSPAMNERFAFPGGHHAPNNSIAMSRAGHTATSHATSPTGPGLPPRPFNSTSWQGQQNGASSNFPDLAALSLEERPASSTAPGFYPATQGLNAGNLAQGWPSNRQSRHLHNLAALDGQATMPTAVPRHMPQNRGSVPAHSSPTFPPQGAHYAPPQDHRSQGPSPHETALRTLVNGQISSVFEQHGRLLNQAAAFDLHTQQQSMPEMINGGPPYANLLTSGAQQNLGHPSGYQVAPNSHLSILQASQNQYPAAKMRSDTLDEFQKQKYNPKWELKHVFGHVAEFSGDNQGAKFIQNKLDTASCNDRERVFTEIMYNAPQLMKDVYANYVVQKVFELGTQVQKKALGNQIQPIIYELSTHQYACRVVQTALKYVLLEQQLELAHMLKPNLLKTMLHPQGNHVVQKIIEVLDRKYLDFVMDAMRGRIADLSAEPFACRVVQAMLKKGADEDIKDIFDEFYPSAQRLASQGFGNYVAQVLLEKAATPDRANLIGFLTPIAVGLTRDKGGSKVVEKCLAVGTPAQVSALHREFTKPAPDGRSRLVGMILDGFGNYTIQWLYKWFKTPGEVGYTDDAETTNGGASPDQGRTPEQESFRAEVQAAVDTLRHGELGYDKNLTPMAALMDLRVPMRPGNQAPAPVGTGLGGQHRS